MRYVRFRAPAIVQLRRAQLILMLATLVPTLLITALGIILLAVRSSSVGIIIGLLVLAFCTTSITGYILGSMFVSRGASIARVQNDFLSAVSHELRTPLTSIRLFMETLRDERLTDPTDKRQCLDLLEQEVGRLEGLVERLIELSRMETGKHHFERQNVLVADVVQDAMAAVNAATLPEKIAVEIDIEDGLYVTGDHAALTQTVVNLLTNAWKYTPSEDKQISLVARSMGERRVELVVADNGPGIPKGEQKQIFDKFERGKEAIDQRKSGVGLGLATVRAIIRAHKGRIELQSRPGQGSEFRIILRRQRDKSSAAAPVPDMRSEKPADRSRVELPDALAEPKRSPPT
ncbi:MAG: HAMP domain-containing histidine kinase [Proteobacteria bacterium]|nr:HAMP domain-containing histidine kinase [Pseudomonadota bacterium]